MAVRRRKSATTASHLAHGRHTRAPPKEIDEAELLEGGIEE